MSAKWGKVGIYALSIKPDTNKRKTGWEAAGNKQILVNGFAEFCPAVRELVGRAGDDLKMWQLYDMEALPHYVDGSVALIGDAAHPFQPCVLASLVLARLLRA